MAWTDLDPDDLGLFDYSRHAIADACSYRINGSPPAHPFEFQAWVIRTDFE